MSQAASLGAPPHAGSATASRWAFALTALGAATAAAVLAGWAPLRFSIVTVFLFAGPHNWLEFRYFLTRMPARWGRLRGFFLFAFAGVFALAAAFAGLVVLFGRVALDAAFQSDYHRRLEHRPYPLDRRRWLTCAAGRTRAANGAWIWPVAFVSDRA